MGTNYSFLLQICVESRCYSSLQHNTCKSLVVRVVVVAIRRYCKNSVKKCENNLEIRKSVCIFASRKVRKLWKRIYLKPI